MKQMDIGFILFVAFCCGLFSSICSFGTTMIAQYSLQQVIGATVLSFLVGGIVVFFLGLKLDK